MPEPSDPKKVSVRRYSLGNWANIVLLGLGIAILWGGILVMLLQVAIKLLL